MNPENYINWEGKETNPKTKTKSYTIEHKFDVGQIVWFMKNNKATQAIIEIVSVDKFQQGVIKTEVKYKLNFTDIVVNRLDCIFLEESLFLSKKELLESL